MSRVLVTRVALYCLSADAHPVCESKPSRFGFWTDANRAPNAVIPDRRCALLPVFREELSGL